MVAHLNETETKLDQASARAKTLSGRNKTLLTQIDEYKAQLDTLRASAERQAFELGAVIDSQKVQIASLSEERDTLTAQTQSLSAERIALNDSVARLTTTTNTVYYVIGKEDDLIKKGVVKKEGSKFLFFGGTSLQPARALSPENFTAVDKTQELVIPMPASDKATATLRFAGKPLAASRAVPRKTRMGAVMRLISRLCSAKNGAPSRPFTGLRVIIFTERISPSAAALTASRPISAPVGTMI